MINHRYPPDREADLVQAATQFGNWIADNEAEAGLTTVQATTFGAKLALFIAQRDVALAPLTRGPANVLQKEILKQDLVSYWRELVRIAQAFPGTNDFTRAQMGIPIRKNREANGVPTVTPFVTVGARSDNTVTLHLRAEASQTARRTKPAGVRSAFAYAHVGPTRSTNPDDYTFMGASNRTSLTIAFPPELPEGTTVWVAVAWANARNQAGPACEAMRTTLVGGGMQMQGQAMKIAA
jgi:hypothetical protein